jgi:RNA polymerase sigma-70 factor (ECF subfamily)
MSCDGEFKMVQARNWNSTVSDEALVAIAQEGSRAAFAELILRHQKTVFGVVQRITRNTHDTEDVLQDCSIRAFTHILNFDGKSAFSTWLVRIGINTALMMLRKRRNTPVTSLDEHLLSDLRGPWQIAEPSNNPEQELLEREAQLRIKQAVMRLPASLRSVVEANLYHDRPLKELAGISGMSVAATKSRLYRARVALRRHMRHMRKESFGRLR